jgi:hypothetical protein
MVVVVAHIIPVQVVMQVRQVLVHTYHVQQATELTDKINIVVE